MPDFLDEILEPKKQADKNGDGHWLCVGERAKNSAELEAREAEYLKSDLLPIPFYGSDGTLEPLTKQDLAHLKDLGISLDEYTQLVGESL